METPSQACVRILTALEDLVAQESAVLRAGDFAAVLRIQSRAEPLVTFLAAHVDPARAAGVGERVAILHVTRQGNLACLGREMARTRDELSALAGQQRLIARIAPAYGATPGGSRQLSLVG